MTQREQSNGRSLAPVLITGAGMVAAYTAAALIARGAEVILYDIAPSRAYLATVFDIERAHIYTGDITSLPEVAAVAQRHQAGCIFHTAALIGASVARQPFRGVEVNVGGSVAVAEAARLAGVRRVVFCSSIAVYDLKRVPPDSAIREDSPLGPNNLYGATKVASEQILEQYSRIFDFEVVRLRLAVVLGRGQYSAGSWMGRKVNAALQEVLAGREAVLQREWLGTQEYVYVKDAAQAAATACLMEGNLAGALNVGTGRLHNCQEVVAEIEAAVPGTRVKVIDSSPPRLPDQQRTQAFDSSKAQAALGYEPQYTFRAGLLDYLAELRQYGGSYPVPD